MSLLSLLTSDRLVQAAGRTIYKRGLIYYHEGRVNIEFADNERAWGTVQGTYVYRFSFELVKNSVLMDCICPYAEKGYVCKHLVAAGLAVAEYLRKNPSAQKSTWEKQMSQVRNLVENLVPARAKPTYWLFISLSRHNDEWELIPYEVPLTQLPDEVTLPATQEELIEQFPHLLQQNPSLRYLCRAASTRRPYTVDNCLYTSSEDIGFINFLISQERYYNQYSYYYDYSDVRARSSGFLLPLLAKTNLPLYLGDAQNPVLHRLHIITEPARLGASINRSENNDIQFKLFFQAGTKRLFLDNTPVIISRSSPVIWFLLTPYVFSLMNKNVNVWDISDLLSHPTFLIPADQEELFLDEFLPTLAQAIELDGVEITWEEIQTEPVKRLYLVEEGDTLQVHLRFGYGPAEVVYDRTWPEVTVQRKPESWTLYRIYRDPIFEQEVWQSISSPSYGLKRSGQQYDDHIFLLRAKVHPLDFLMRHVPRLAEAGFEIYGEENLKSIRVNRSRPTLSLNVSSGIDWFDLQAVVKFGDLEASLKDIRRAIKRKERYIKLADGSIGEIPEEWIKKYKHLFSLGEQTADGLRFANHHLTLLDQLLAEADRVQLDSEFQARKKRLLEFKGIQSQPLPAGFKGELRPYQKAGFDWLHFLHEYGFGGCLADDMGLGKTVETLVFLLSLKESGHSRRPSLLVLPRSLLVNWQREVERFTPALTCYEYFGASRTRDIQMFDNYDLIFTTYGVMLRDIEQLRQYRFHYVILDESQAIKNPLAKTAKAARLLNADHRLALTGTPVENSTFELWSQFAFLNPGLLGNLEYFKQEFGNPIERKGDETASQFLRKMVYPFILRRTKDQVAPELPPRTERIVYADMTPAQRKLYQKTRDQYRARLLGLIEQQGLRQTRMQILEGLLRLRQICNHPRLVTPNFRGDSAKLELLLDTLKTLQAEGHKALVFSQFVQMLKIIQHELDQRKIPYVYLDGRTRKRQERVDTFQNNPDIPFFLISLKAGGVGLNLTAADYVIHVDPWWNPAVEMQATDRTHRIGQEKPVFIYKLITRDSVEEKIVQLQNKKKELVQQLITTDSSFFKNLTLDDVQVLFS